MFGNKPAQAPLQETYEPYRAPSVHSDVGVPLLQALVTGALIGTLAAAALVTLGATLETAAFAWLLATTAVTTVAWFWRLSWAENTVEKIESITGRDLNGDGEIGVHGIVVNGQRAAPRNEQEIWADKARTFVTWTYKHGTSLRAIRSSKLFTESEIEKLSSMILRPDLDVARWKHPGDRKSGWGYTCNIEQALERVSRIMWVPDKTKK